MPRYDGGTVGRSDVSKAERLKLEALPKVSGARSGRGYRSSKVSDLAHDLLLGEKRSSGGNVIVRTRGAGKVTKGVLRQGVAPRLARRTPVAGTFVRPAAPLPPRAVVGKADLPVLGRLARVFGSGVKQGAALDAGKIAKPKLRLGDAVATAGSKPLQTVHGAGQAVGLYRKPLVALGAAGAGGALVGDKVGKGVSTAVRRKDAAKGKANPDGTYPITNRHQALAARKLALSGHGSPADRASALRRANEELAKRAYDPENERRFRQGAAASALGIAGAGGVGYAARDVREHTRVARAGQQMPQSGAPAHRGVKRQLVILDDDGKKIEGKIVKPRLVHASERLARGKAIAISRHGLGVGLAGIGALGASGAILRNRHEPRWD